MSGTGETLGGAEIGRQTRPKLAGAGKKRPAGMPKVCFSRPVTPRHDGKVYPVEVWSAPGKWCVRLRADGRCFYGATRLEAWTACIEAIDPSVDRVVIG